MLNKRHAAAQSVANELFPAENVLDEAILRNAKLAIAVVNGRRLANMPLSTGQEALHYVAQANVKMCEARGMLAEAHRAFREAQIAAGLSAFSYGDEQACPPSKGELRVVAASANAA